MILFCKNSDIKSSLSDFFINVRKLPNDGRHYVIVLLSSYQTFLTYVSIISIILRLSEFFDISWLLTYIHLLNISVFRFFIFSFIYYNYLNIIMHIQISFHVETFHI